MKLVIEQMLPESIDDRANRILRGYRRQVFILPAISVTILALRLLFRLHLPAHLLAVQIVTSWGFLLMASAGIATLALASWRRKIADAERLGRFEFYRRELDLAIRWCSASRLMFGALLFVSLGLLAVQDFEMRMVGIAMAVSAIAGVAYTGLVKLPRLRRESADLVSHNK
jgi:hypothetical protein